MRESEEVGGEQCASKYWLELAIFWWQREAGSSSFANLTIRWCWYLDRIFSGDLFLSCLSWIPPLQAKATRHRDTEYIWYGPQFLRIKLPITTHVAFWSMEQAYSKKQGKKYRKKETSYSVKTVRNSECILCACGMWSSENGCHICALIITNIA